MNLSVNRIKSIDILRGLVMIIMALDHTREFFHRDAFMFSATDLSQTNAPLFFTRWITHFCAPVFMFLAGTSAYLMGRRRSKKELSMFLLTRGIWLVFVDLVIMNFVLSFDAAFHVFFFNVIWALGLCMIFLALLIYLPVRIILVVGLMLVFGHNLLDSVNINGNGAAAFVWAILHKQAFFQYGTKSMLVVYPILPWVGVMAIGYCLGTLYTERFTPPKRKRILLMSGCMAVLLFVALRFLNIYGDPSHWKTQDSAGFSFLSFLNVSKYPPSLLFLLMTLGPALLFLAVTENMTGKLANIISVYGRVPFFYFVMHITLIHLLALVAAQLTPGYSWTDMILKQSFLDTSHLKGYGLSLGATYLVWLLVVISMYPLCRWFDSYKMKHKEKRWLSYL
jgi:uncharacterized membrane protein